MANCVVANGAGKACAKIAGTFDASQACAEIAGTFDAGMPALRRAPALPGVMGVAHKRSFTRSLLSSPVTKQQQVGSRLAGYSRPSDLEGIPQIVHVKVESPIPMGCSWFRGPLLERP